MGDLQRLGAEWLREQVMAMPDTIERMGPVEYNEANRYIPQGVSPRPGYIRYDLFPYLREIINCFDPLSPVREVNLMKGVQTGYTTALESVLFYYIGHIQTAPAMFLTADGELAKGRVDNNILPMLNESGMADRIRTADEGNNRKSGKTKDYLQWVGGGYLIYNGAMNGAKMRQYSVPLMLKDELDGWKRSVGKDGDSDTTTDARLSAYWPVRKIFRGSTPLQKPSMIFDAYKRGDQRIYKVLCKACSYPQELRFDWRNEKGGFRWDTVGDVLQLESVRYCCANCGHAHFEHDKERLFATEHGAYWEPTAEPREAGIRSYHLPAFYSPFGFRPWYKGVSDYLSAFDPVNKTTRSIAKLQEFYNNTLGTPFEVVGGKVRFTMVSGHRRTAYVRGQIPNEYAKAYAGGRVLLLTCSVDVHEKNLAVTVIGWARNSIAFVVDYWRFESDDCREVSAPAWDRLRQLIEEKTYTADDGAEYRIALTLVDAGYSHDTVVTFCSDYAGGVVPILGRDRPAKAQTIREFAEFKTQAGTVGYRILVDHYKDRMAAALRREWTEDSDQQRAYHFNAPVDMTDDELKELTVETLREREDNTGNVSHYWHRPQGARNELWDNLGYGHAGVEIIAWSICIQQFELETVDWPQFWDYLEAKAPYYRLP